MATLDCTSHCFDWALSRLKQAEEELIASGVPIRAIFPVTRVLFRYDPKSAEFTPQQQGLFTEYDRTLVDLSRY